MAQDGRVLFILPWMGISLAGTTDNKSSLTTEPKATGEDVSFILTTVNAALNCPIDERDVLSAWSGLRPLASDPSKANTESISRDHVCVLEDTGMVSIMGGKWTTFRKMAEDAVDAAVHAGGLRPSRDACTKHVKLHGSCGWSRTLHIALAREIDRRLSCATADAENIDVPATAARLATAYGGKAMDVLEIGEWTDSLRPLVRGHPILEAEVVYAARYEYCMTAADFLARRSRLAFTHVDAAKKAIPRVIDILKREHNWGKLRTWREKRAALKYMKQFEKEAN